MSFCRTPVVSCRKFLMATLFRQNKSLFLVLTALALSGCGGGSGGTGGTLSNPAPPAPPPPPNYDTAEYRANYGLGAINALAAYEDGLSGNGVIVAVIDTGVDLDHPDLDGNINPASRGTSVPSFAGADDADADGHGTAVAGIIAAEKNNSGMHGVAFNASLLAINATEPGTCPGDCEFAQNDLATALDYVVTQGAKVINLSLGGSAPGFFLSQAMERAVEAGAIIVISAGNKAGNKSEAEPSEFAQVAGAAWAQGRIIIVGATDEANALADFSNKAGDTLKHLYLVAPGVSIRTTGKGGTQVLASGTSFSAPHASGALALLAEKFPNLTAAELVEILLNSAQDLGAAGVDAEYGHGLIDLAAAIAPIGTVGVPTGGGIVPANTDTPSLNISAMELSPVFGDALTSAPALQQAMALDGYRRSYRVDLTQAISRPQAMASLAGISHQLRYERRQVATVGDGATLDLTATPPTALDQLLDPREQTGDTTARVRLVRTLPSGVRMTLAINDQGQNTSTPALFSRPIGFADTLDQTLAAAWAWPLAQRHDIGLEVMRGHNGKGATHWGRWWLDSRWGDGLSVTLGLGQMTERGSVLGALSTGALGLGEGAITRFVDGSARWSPDPGVTFHVGASWGRTQVTQAPHSLLRVDGGITTWSAEAGATWYGVWDLHDQLHLRLTLPHRVETGNVLIGQVFSRDYDRNTLLYAETRATLAPSGRERNMEIGYRLPLGDQAHVRAHVFYVQEPGHQADAADAVALLVSYARQF